jgi:hypothetical protein
VLAVLVFQVRVVLPILKPEGAAAKQVTPGMLPWGVLNVRLRPLLLNADLILVKDITSKLLILLGRSALCAVVWMVLTVLSMISYLASLIVPVMLITLGHLLLGLLEHVVLALLW